MATDQATRFDGDYIVTAYDSEYGLSAYWDIDGEFVIKPAHGAHQLWFETHGRWHLPGIGFLSKR